MPTIKVGSKHTFLALEKFLESKPGTFLVVENIEYRNERAVMHVFGGNFCGDWKSGDGVLFYADGEVHSAEPGDHFKVISINQP